MTKNMIEKVWLLLIYLTSQWKKEGLTNYTKDMQNYQNAMNNNSQYHFNNSLIPIFHMYLILKSLSSLNL